MNRFVTGFLTGLLSGLAVAAVAMLWLKGPSAERLEHTSALQAPAVPQAPAAALPIAVDAPPVPEQVPQRAAAISQPASGIESTDTRNVALCEIQAHADVEDRSREADWQRIAANMELEPWWNEFVDATHSVRVKNTRVTYVTFLFRKSPLTR